MASAAFGLKNNLERFRFQTPAHQGDMPAEKLAFLAQLKKTVPDREAVDCDAKPGCLYSLELGVIFLDWEGQLVTRAGFGALDHPFPDNHKDASFLRVSERGNIAVTATTSGHFKLWNIKERKVVEELVTSFPRVGRVELTQTGYVFLDSNEQLFVLDPFKKLFAEIKPKKEELRFELEWAPVDDGETPALVLPRAEHTIRDTEGMTEGEREIMEMAPNYDEVMNEISKKTRRSTINRHQFLSGLNRNFGSSKPQLLFLDARGLLLWGHDQLLEVFDYGNVRFLGSFALGSPPSALATNAEQTQFFVGLKSGSIKIFDAQDLLESGELIGHTDTISTIRVTSGAHPLVFAGAFDGAVRVFHLKLMEELAELVSKTNPISSKVLLNERRRANKEAKMVRFRLGTQNTRKKVAVSCLDIEAGHKSVFCLYEGQIIRWKIDFDYKLFELRGDKGDLTHAAIDPSQAKVMFLWHEGRVVKRDILHDSDLVKSAEIEGTVSCLSVSRDGSLVCLGMQSGELGLLDATNLFPVKKHSVSQKPLRSVESYKNEFFVIQDDVGAIFFLNFRQEMLHELDQKIVKLTSLAINEEDDLLFIAAQELVLRHWDLRPLRHRLPPVELPDSFPLALPIHTMAFDKSKKLLFFSQRESVSIFDFQNREVVSEVFPNNLGEEPASLPVGSRIFSVSNLRLGANVDAVLSDLVATVKREEHAVCALFHVPELNVLVILRKNGIISCWDQNTGLFILDFNTGHRLVRGFHPTSGTTFFAWTDTGLLLGFDLFRQNFFDCCYLHTFSGNMPEGDFSKKMASFFELAAFSPFIRKVLHPVSVAFLLNKVQGLRQLVANWGYPVLDEFQTSPLILSLEGRHVNFAENLCIEMARFKSPITLGYHEICTLLRFDYKFAKTLLSHSCERVEHFTNTGERIRKFNFLLRDHAKVASLSGHFTRRNLQELLAPVPEADEEQLVPELNEHNPLNELEEEEETKENFVEAQQKKDKLRSASLLASQNYVYTDLFRVKGFYDFETGSLDDIRFLFQYSESRVEAFVLSDWKNIINFKWAACRRYFILLALFYWSFMLFFSLFIFNPTVQPFFYAALTLVTLLSIYELVPLIGYPQYYLHNLTCFLDLLMYLTAAFVLFWVRREPTLDSEALQTLEVLSLGIGFYKGISFLRIFDMMRSMTFIIYSLFGNSLDVIFLMLYLATGLAIVMNLTMPVQPLYSQFVWVLYMAFCSFPIDEKWTLLHFAVVVLLIFLLSLLMVNFVVAKMSSKYFELERNQKATNYQQMAKVIFEFELWYRLLRRRGDSFKTTTYFVMKSAEPSFDVPETTEKADEIDFREIVKSLDALKATLMKLDNNLAGLEHLKRDVSKLTSNLRGHDPSREIRSIKARLSLLQKTPPELHPN